MTLHKHSIRQVNETSILEYIIHHHEISRVDLSKVSGLPKSSITEITKNLLLDAMIVQTGSGPSSMIGGRRPVMLRLNAYSASFISIRLHTTGISALSVLTDGSISSHYEVQAHVTALNVCSLVERAIDHLLEHAPITARGVCGVSIAYSGILKKGQLIYAPEYTNAVLTSLPDFRERYEFPVYFNNEAHLSALAHITHEQNTAYDSIVCLSLEDVVNAGIITRQNPLMPGHTANGIIDHNTLYPNGKLCTCGNIGCVGQYCSVSSLLKNYRDALSDHTLSLKQLIADFQDSDPTVCDILEQFCYDTALVIHNLFTSVNPDVMIVNSPLLHKYPDLLDLIKRNLKPQTRHILNLRQSPLTCDDVMMGGAVNCIMHYLNISKFRYDT